MSRGSKRDDGDAGRSGPPEDYESKSDDPGNAVENTCSLNVSPSSNQLSSASGEPSDSPQNNEGYSDEKQSAEQVTKIFKLISTDKFFSSCQLYIL